MQYLPFAQLPFRRHSRKLSPACGQIFILPDTRGDHEAERRETRMGAFSLNSHP
jgi:hypothetical protein